MKSHSVKSNAKRIARQLAERHPGIVAVEPVEIPKAGPRRLWYPAVERSAHGELQAEVTRTAIVQPTAYDAAPAPAAAATPGGKTGRMLEMLQAPAGATVAEIAAAFGWQAHTTRAAISVQTRKARLAVATEMVDGRGRVYRAAPAEVPHG